jgi:hypothetical protein
LLKYKEECFKKESKAIIHTVCKNIACLKQLKKQKRFLKSKSKDMLCYSLKTLNKLKKAKEREKQEEEKRHVAITVATLCNNLQPN